MSEKLPIQSPAPNTFPNPRRTKLVGGHVGLTQAYELRDTASDQANELRDCPALTLEDKATRAQALRNLASVWEVASDRIRIIKNKPMNNETQINPADATRCPIAMAVRRIQDLSPAQLAFLALNGSYGEKLVASMLLESIARGMEGAEDREQRIENRAFPKGRWTV